VITKQHTQECLSRAFVLAVSGAAGVNVEMGKEFDYGFDGQFKPVMIRGPRRVESGFHLDYQLKSTTNWWHEGDDVVYDLEAKTYNDLVDRDPDATGAVLILLCLPDDEAQWVSFTEDALALRRCCYWTRLQGEPTDNVAKKRVFIPRQNLLTVASLRQVLLDERERRSGAQP